MSAAERKKREEPGWNLHSGVLRRPMDAHRLAIAARSTGGGDMESRRSAAIYVVVRHLRDRQPGWQGRPRRGHRYLENRENRWPPSALNRARCWESGAGAFGAGYLFRRSRRALRTGSSRTLPRRVRVFARARVWQDKKELHPALSDANAAIRLQPNDAAAFYQRATIWLDKNVIGKAVTDSNTALRLDPNLLSANLCGGLGFFQNEYQGSIADFDVAIRLEPRYVAADVSREISSPARRLRQGHFGLHRRDSHQSTRPRGLFQPGGNLRLQQRE